jgi:predicted thioredoxin/glutaredoxin
MKKLDIYSRQGCHLCDVLIEQLLPLVHGRLDVVVHDIDTRDEWREKYDTRVPVVEYDGELVCQYHLDPGALERVLSTLTA